MSWDCISIISHLFSEGLLQVLVDSTPDRGTRQRQAQRLRYFIASTCAEYLEVHQCIPGIQWFFSASYNWGNPLVSTQI
jgi:hypothetical protein